MKSFLDLDDRTTSSFCGNDFDLDKERELNKRLSSWYGEEKLLIERKSDARKVIGSLKSLDGREKESKWPLNQAQES